MTADPWADRSPNTRRGAWHQFELDGAAIVGRMYGLGGGAWADWLPCGRYGADAGQACTEKRGEVEVAVFAHIERQRARRWPVPGPRWAQDEHPTPDGGAGLDGDEDLAQPRTPTRTLGRSQWYQRAD